MNLRNSNMVIVMRGTMEKCPECNRESSEAQILLDENTKRLACKLCRLKTEIISAGHACFVYIPERDEVVGCLSLWDPSTSKVLAEK